MNNRWVKWYEIARTGCYVPVVMCAITFCSTAAHAQTCVPTPTPNLRATLLLGLTDAKQNSNGTLTVQADTLQFTPDGKAAVVVPVTAVQDIFVGGQSRQIGGLPMTLGKAAVPFGGGRAISLFSHKKYDTLTVKYVDPDGGMHGAVFQLPNGQAESLRRQLIAKGAHVSEDVEQDCKPAPTGGTK